MPVFGLKKLKIGEKMHYLFLQLIVLESTLKKQSNSPHLIFQLIIGELMRRIQTLTSPAAPKTPKNQLFLGLDQITSNFH